MRTQAFLPQGAAGSMFPRILNRHTLLSILFRLPWLITGGRRCHHCRSLHRSQIFDLRIFTAVSIFPHAEKQGCPSLLHVQDISVISPFPETDTAKCFVCATATVFTPVTRISSDLTMSLKRMCAASNMQPACIRLK